MKILSVGQLHDFNVCLFDTENREFKYFKEERLSGIKHDGGVNFIKSEIKNFKPDRIYFCWGNSIEHMSDLSGEITFKELERIKNKIEYAGEASLTAMEHRLYMTLDRLSQIYDLSDDTVLHWVQHDYAHILSGWMLADDYTSVEYGVSIDGGGPDRNTKLILQHPFDLTRVKVLFSEKYNSYGHLFSELGSVMRLSGSSLDMAGKLMGLQAYGRFSDRYASNLKVSYLRNRLYEVIKENASEFNNSSNLSENSDFLDFLATTHQMWNDCGSSSYQVDYPWASNMLTGAPIR